MNTLIKLSGVMKTVEFNQKPATHTEGPWEVEPYEDDYTGNDPYLIRQVDQAGFKTRPETLATVHETSVGQEIALLNAKLIAAAPTLLDSVDALLGLISGLAPRLNGELSEDQWKIVLKAEDAVKIGRGQ